MTKNIFLLIFVLHASVIDSGGSVGRQNEMDVFRLPNRTMPISYDLKITLYYDESSDPVGYEGEVEIVISVKAKTSEITLNCKNLSVDVIYIFEKDSLLSVEVINWQTNTRNEQLNIFVDYELDINILYVLSIEFRGTIGHDTNGFYKSTYYNKDDSHRE
jgi:hypothetical protein